MQTQPEFLSDTKNAIRKAYLLTDEKILEKAAELGRGGSTAVTAILISSNDSVKLVVANIGDSRAVISKNGKAEQLSIDHEPSMEREIIEEKGGFVSNLPGTTISCQFLPTRYYMPEKASSFEFNCSEYYYFSS